MSGRKPVRTRGKLQLSRYFQELEKGDSVAVVREASVIGNFPKRLQGRTGKVIGKKGRAYIVKLKDQNAEKEYILKAIHLRKIKTLKKQE